MSKKTQSPNKKVCATAPKATVPDPKQPMDALALWGRDSATAVATGPSAIRLDGNERLVIPFTASIVRVKLHYLNLAAINGYVHCNDNDCLLCRLGRQVETRDLLPVYDALDKAVGVLPISTNIRAGSLRNLLMPVLQKLKDQPRLLVGIRKMDNNRFVVGTYDLPANADDGADAILTFMGDFDAGRIDLASVFTRQTNEELAALPEIADMMAMKGVKVS